ncbi:glycosyl transferase family 90-domain-containing protein [Mycena albidolilacea]|uniref:Glycosyl transferase family 90-domain-containing protein n=1 Tax=Mycena albidolilacea TaxID=1033008 RepID=A0AAD7ARR9_9AGAR|nr:glycosyl transferase family 90-domain-containing protein [Mycena albidolilacea]
MPRISLRGHNPIRWSWRSSIWLLAAFAVGRASHFLPLFPPSIQDPGPPATEHVPPSPERIILDPYSTSAKALALAQSSLDAVLDRQSTTLDEAVARYSLKAARPPPPNFDQWFLFAQKNKCLIDDYDQIQRDFEPFYQLAIDHPAYFQTMIEKGQAMILEETAGLNRKQQEAVGMTAIRIKDGELQMPPYSGTAFAKDLPYHLRKIAFLLPDVEFLLNGRDEPRVVFNSRELGARARASSLEDSNPFHITPYPTAEFFRNQSGCNLLSKTGFPHDESPNIAFLRSSSSSDFTTDLWPLLSMTKLSPCFSDILFPGQYFYHASRWSAKLPPTEIPWEDKKSQLYWRGSSNGGHIVGDNYHSFPRFRLVELGREHPELMNVKMTRFAEGHCKKDCDRDRVIAEYNITGPFSSRKETMEYKYVLDIDGNTFSGRFLNLLKSGSLVFKSTVFEEYFNDWIRPYEHYIPVKPDLSDLVEKVEWAISHEGEARRIQETGKLFTQRVMTDEQNNCYFAAVLLEWARLQNYTETGL